jgi:hypothetical protein
MSSLQIVAISELQTSSQAGVRWRIRRRLVIVWSQTLVQAPAGSPNAQALLAELERLANGSQIDAAPVGSPARIPFREASTEWDSFNGLPRASRGVFCTTRAQRGFVRGLTIARGDLEDGPRRENHARSSTFRNSRTLADHPRPVRRPSCLPQSTQFRNADT